MKIEDMNIEQIEEYICENFSDTNLYMKCLDCNEYFLLNEMDLGNEVCHDCSDDDNEEDQE